MDNFTNSDQVLDLFFDDFPQKGKLLIMMHNHPDPDSISSAAALAEIASVLGKAKTTIAYGGVIGRSENAQMVKYVGLKPVLIEKVDIKKFDRIAMVDTQPQTGNNSLPKKFIPDLVIDHHPMIRYTKKVKFVDIRLEYGATASILTEYMFKLGLEVSKSLATALIYGIKSETQDLGREANSVDIECYLKLFPLANKKLLSKIVNSRVARVYFKYLQEALQNAEVVGNAVVTTLAELSNPDIVPEVADLLLRMEGSSWSFCSGVYQNSIYLSIRTTNVRKNAGKLMKELLKGKGTGGGHGLMAGGKVDVGDMEAWQINELQEKIESDFLKKINKTQFSRSPLTKVNGD